MKSILIGLLTLSLFAFSADKKVSDLTALPESGWATGDLFPIVDISASATKKTSVADFDLRYFKLSDILTVGRGGTGQALPSAGNLLYSNGTSYSLIGAACGSNQTIKSNGSGAWACGDFGTVATGGIGITSGTSGGILGFTATGTIASSALLSANQLIIGGGAGATPSTLAAGSQYQVLRMGASNPAYGSIALNESAAVTGTLAVGNGGSGAASFTANNVLLGNGSSAFQVVAPGTSGNVLTSNGTTWQSTAAAASPTTTKGDLAGFSTVAARVPSDTDGKYLRSDASLTLGIGYGYPTTVSKTANYTATGLDEIILADTSGGAFTLTLPAAASFSGKVYRVVMNGTGPNSLTIDPNASETICGLTTIKLSGFGDGIEIVSNGTNWMSINGGCYRTVAAILDNNGACTVVNETSPRWIASISHPSTGNCTSNFISGIWSAAPTCTCSPLDTAGSLFNCVLNPNTSSVTSGVSGAAGAATDRQQFLTCTGPR